MKQDINTNRVRNQGKFRSTDNVEHQLQFIKTSNMEPSKKAPTTTRLKENCMTDEILKLIKKKNI